ncbi:MAG: hypothetical protein HKN07_05940 [Acidimicrobiia bacterium]|nr:hypothetical protein [Acidimicrobiia bacterium]
MLWLRLIVAIVIGISFFALSLWVIRQLATPPPPEPDPEDIELVDMPFVCTVCGMRLSVTQTHGEELRAPRHCREEMDPVPG